MIAALVGIYNYTGCNYTGCSYSYQRTLFKRVLIIILIANVQCIEKYALKTIPMFSYYDGRATYGVIVIENHLNKLQDIQYKLACIVK